jgi:hypothetical protein
VFIALTGIIIVGATSVLTITGRKSGKMNAGMIGKSLETSDDGTGKSGRMRNMTESMVAMAATDLI